MSDTRDDATVEPLGIVPGDPADDDIVDLRVMPRRTPADTRTGPASDRAAGSPSRKDRDRFLDLVRTVAILRVLVIHAAGTAGWLWWPAPSWVLPGMPLVFFTTGALSVGSLDRHGASGFYRDRFRRLLVPYWALLATGLLTLIVAATVWGGDEWTPRWWRLPDAIVPVVQPRVSPGLTALGSHLWFASSFLLLLALTPWLARIHRQHPLRPLVGCVAAWAVSNWVDRSLVAVPIELLYVPMYGMFLTAGFGYADGTLVHRPGRTAPGTRPTVRPAVAATIVGLAAIGGWLSFRYGTRDLNHDLVGHACVAAGWLVLVLAAREPLGRLAHRAAPLVDRITPRTLTLYLWGAPVGVLAWVLASRVEPGAFRSVTFVALTAGFTGVALCIFGRVEDLAAGRRGHGYASGAGG
jgi:fucose 4-O-acetylase-like acetyltransferase